MGWGPRAGCLLTSLRQLSLSPSSLPLLAFSSCYSGIRTINMVTVSITTTICTISIIIIIFIIVDCSSWWCPRTQGGCAGEKILYGRCPNFGTMEGSIVLTRVPLELMEWQWVSMVANNRPKVQSVLNPCSGLLYRVALSHIILNLQEH